MLLILECLNTEFRKLFLPVFNFQTTLLNDTIINIFETVDPTNLTTYHHFKKKKKHTHISNTHLCFQFKKKKNLLEI